MLNYLILVVRRLFFYSWLNSIGWWQNSTGGAGHLWLLHWYHFMAYRIGICLPGNSHLVLYYPVPPLTSSSWICSGQYKEPCSQENILLWNDVMFVILFHSQILRKSLKELYFPILWMTKWRFSELASGRVTVRTQDFYLLSPFLLVLAPS